MIGHGTSPSLGTSASPLSWTYTGHEPQRLAVDLHQRQTLAHVPRRRMHAGIGRLAAAVGAGAADQRGHFG